MKEKHYPLICRILMAVYEHPDAKWAENVVRSARHSRMSRELVIEAWRSRHSYSFAAPKKPSSPTDASSKHRLSA